MTTVMDLPAGSVLLPCDHVVSTGPGELARCPHGCDPLVPEHSRPAPQPARRA